MVNRSSDLVAGFLGKHWLIGLCGGMFINSSYMTPASFQQIDITKTDCGTVSSYPLLCSFTDRN